MTNFNTNSNLIISNAMMNKDSGKVKKVQNQSNQSFKDHLSIKKVAQSMESLLLSKHVGIVFEHIKLDPLVKNGQANDIYKTMWVDAICEELSKSGSFGIAKTVERQLRGMNNISSTDNNGGKIDERDGNHNKK